MRSVLRMLLQGTARQLPSPLPLSNVETPCRPHIGAGAAALGAELRLQMGQEAAPEVNVWAYSIA